jgi:predicted porin
LLGGALNDTGSKTASNITTGLLPNYLSVSGTTRQNDLDVAFTISIQPGTSNTGALQYKDTITAPKHATQENRQAFLTFGDKSWGSIKLGKDIGVYASDAILNDMTLLGVGGGAGVLAGNTTTLGRIGTGYIYADWKPQITYTTPNFSGFSATGGITQAWNADTSSGRGGASPAFEGKASYSFNANGVDGKVWVSGITQKVEKINAGGGNLVNDRSNAVDIGTNLNVAGLGLTAYYNNGEGMGTLGQLLGGYDAAGKARDSDDWYVQATYVLPTKTKVGLSYGESNLDGNSGDTFKSLTNDMWTVGAYHPLTKHLNLVAEYSDLNVEAVGNSVTGKAKAKTASLGAILFF